MRGTVTPQPRATQGVRRLSLVPPFVPGLQLAHASTGSSVVAPILDPHVPASDRVPRRCCTRVRTCSASTPSSRPITAGVRACSCSLPDSVAARACAELVKIVDDALPDTFRGYRDAFPPRDGMAACHQVWVHTVGDFFARLLGFDPRRAYQCARLAAHADAAAARAHRGRGVRGRVRRADAACASSWRGIRTTCGATSSRASGTGSRRKRRSSAACGQVGDELGSAAVVAGGSCAT